METIQRLQDWAKPDPIGELLVAVTDDGANFGARISAPASAQQMALGLDEDFGINLRQRPSLTEPTPGQRLASSQESSAHW